MNTSMNEKYPKQSIASIKTERLMTTLSERITVSQRFLAHAQEQLQVGDLPQASEKGWGAAAHYLKAVAKQRGWTNHSHRDFFIIKDRLAEETNNPNEIKILFGVLRGLHQNFYEPLYTRKMSG